jgi:hypothetical protein
MSYHQKYLKYKQKYLDLKNNLNMSQLGGAKKTKKNNLDIDNLSVLTESPSDFSVYGKELKGGSVFHDANSDEIRTTTTIEDIVGGGNDSIHEEAVETNSSIETSSIEGLDEISSLNDSSAEISVERNNSLDINDLSEMTTDQDGGSDYVIISPSKSDSSDSDSDSSDLDSDTSDSSESD